MYQYGLIGNCQASALIGTNGSIDWLCFPRPDSPPVFGSLLDSEGGRFSIEVQDPVQSHQEYLDSTNILRTTLKSASGGEIRITDFCPRFVQHGRNYRPNAVFRIVEPVSGNPSIVVRCKPVSGWDRTSVKSIQCNNHLRWDLGQESLRLLTNMPLTYLNEESAFIVKEPTYFALTWGFGVEEDLPQVSQRFLSQTIDYWRTWVKHCNIPSLYQKETIRSALALKLHCYEDTGAILAALTTSLPEEPGNTRNWDYRYCWLRDAYFALTAFHNLGHFEEMEGFLHFLLNLVERNEHSRERLRPVYRLDQSLPLPEREMPHWSGFTGARPVRSGNQAAEHIQNDVYGEMILTLGPIFFDDRFKHLRSPSIEDMLRRLANLCEQNISKADAGLWEIRDGWQEHSFSNLMCWAGLDRIEQIQARGFMGGQSFTEGCIRAKKALESAIRHGSLRNGPKDESFDAALLLLPILRYPDEKICLETVLKIQTELGLGEGFLYRYKRKDDFGLPQSAFLICSFWLVQALARVGQIQTARSVMKCAMEAQNPLGLFSEHYLPQLKKQAGNFPQAYSHVGQINATFALSPPWSEIL